MHRSSLRTAVVAVAVALCALSASPRHAVSVAPAIIAADMDTATPGVQATFIRPRSTAPVSVDIVVQNASAVGAFDLEVVFDAQSLVFQSWTEGAFLGSSGRQTVCLPMISERSLRLGCGTYGPPPPPGASGDGVLVTLSFLDAHTSTTCVVLTLAQLATIDGDPLPTTHQNGCVTVIPDADADGVADINDNCPQTANPDQRNTDAANAPLGLPGADAMGDACDADIDGDGYTNAAEAALGKSAAVYCRIMRADVDGDGLVSIFDISLLAEYFLLSVPPAPARYEQGGDLAIGILDLAAIAEVFIQDVTACP